MRWRTWLLVLAFLTGGLIAAGCGGDDDDGGGDDGPAATRERTDADAGVETETTETETTDSEAPEPTDEDIEEGVEDCKRSVAQSPQLSEETKADLEVLCERAGSGDEDAIREASIDVCRKIVEDTIPEQAGQLREQALAACQQAGL
jgi:hypothetical protein